MHADGPRAVGPHGKPVEASASTTASDVGDIWKSDSKYLKDALCTVGKNGAFLTRRSVHIARGARWRPQARCIGQPETSRVVYAHSTHISPSCGLGCSMVDVPSDLPVTRPSGRTRVMPAQRLGLQRRVRP